MSLFDTVVASETLYHDVDESILTEFHPWLERSLFKSDPLLLEIAGRTALEMMPTHKVFIGRMASGEQFIEDDRREWIISRFTPLSVDMETAAVAHVCYVNQKPFLSVRTITDTADHKGKDDFEQNCAKAAQLSAEFVKNMFRISGWSERDEI